MTENPKETSTILENFLIEGEKHFSKSRSQNVFIKGRLDGASSLGAFASYIDPSFITPHHIQLLIEKLEAIETGEIKRLIINMPPRHGKSQLVSRIFPVWCLGRKLNRQIILASYAARLAQRLTRWGRDKAESKEVKDIFPNLQIRKDVRASYEYQNTKGGLVLGAGVDGPITGSGADIAIIDDPYKDYHEAKSELISTNVWDWFRSTLLTRLSPKGVVIVVHTRWMTHDLTARILELEPENWEVVKLPAINLKGEALWQERFPVKELLKIRKSLGESLFQAIYQQEPVDITERLFEEPRFCEPPKDLKIFAYLDPAFGGKDYSALTIGRVGREDKNEFRIYIKAGYIWNSQIDKTYNLVEKYCKQENVTTLYVEANQAQSVLSHEFRKRNLFVRDVKNVSNKHLRIVNYVKVNWDKIYFSKSVDSAYLKQILSYSEHASHDDAPDSLAGLIQALGRGGRPLSARYSFLSRLRGF